MRALSIRQPWASSILHLGKDVENRVWRTRIRGHVAVHAGRTRTDDDVREWLDFVHARGLLEGERFIRDPLERGGIIGIAEIVDCVSESASPWFTGPSGFVIANARPIPFFPLRGRLNFFPLSVEAEQHVRAHVPGILNWA